MNPQLNYILAREHIADLHRTATRERPERDAHTRPGHARRAAIQGPERAPRSSHPSASPTRP
jgi:hypothetical protein